MAAICLLLIAVLAIPVSLTFRLSWRQSLQRDIRLRWLFGLVNVDLSKSGAGPASPDTGADPAAPEREKQAFRKKPNPLAALQQRSFRRRVLRFLREIWHAIEKRDIRLWIRIGLGDPADTGQLWSVVGPLSAVLANYRQVSIEIEPEFIESIFEADSSGDIGFIPLQIIYLMLGLMLSPSIWQGMKRMRGAG